MIDIDLKILNDDLPVPRYAHTGDAGIDLFSTVDASLEPFERKIIPTGIALSIPEGYAGFVQPRSGLAIKKGVTLLNSPGLIDSGYRGEVCAILINLDPKNTFNIKKGDKICQLVIQKVETVKLNIVEKLNESDRGPGGFGSTGV